MQTPMPPPGASPIDPMAAPGQPEPDAETADDGYTVCIQCLPDGTFMVGLDSDDDQAEPPDQEGAPGQPEPPEAGMKPAGSVKEALTMALALIKSGGKDDSAGQLDAFHSADNQQ